MRMKTRTALALCALPLSVSLASALFACGGDAQTAKSPVMASATPSAPSAPEPPPAATVSDVAAAPPKPTLADLAKGAMMTMTDAFNAHDAKKLASIYAMDSIKSSPSPDGWKRVSGRESIEQSFAKFFSSVPDAAIHLSRTLMKGDQAAMEYVGTATDKSSGKSIGVRAASVLWFDADGLVKQEHVYVDGATIAMQAGTMPGKARAVAKPPTGDAQWVLATPSDDGLEAKATSMWPASWQKHDRKAYDASITSDFVHEEIASPNDYIGRDDALKEFDVFDKAVPDQTVTIENAWAASGVVVMEFTFAGTQKGAFGPLKALNKKFTIHGLDFDVITGDKMSKATTYSNSIEYLTQLGVIPSNDAAKDAAKRTTKAPKASKAPKPAKDKRKSRP
jgi:steroid delta-isomerase-like uncharacterized protein